MEVSLLEDINRHKLTVAQLKDELRNRGAKVIGNKAELEDRLKFILTTGTVISQQKGRGKKVPGVISPVGIQIPGEIPKTKVPGRPEGRPKGTTKVPGIPKPKGRPKGRPKGIPKGPIQIPSPQFPVPPTKIPKVSPVAQPHIPLGAPYVSPLGPVTQAPIPGAAPVNPHILQITNLKAQVINNKLTIDQMKKELKAAGLPTTGSKKELNDRLYTYLNSIFLTDPINWTTSQVRLAEGDPSQIFNTFREKTTEALLQTVDPRYYVSFYDLNRKTYHTFQVVEVKRTPFGLVDEIVLIPQGYSLIRYNGKWQLFYQPQAGKLSQSQTTPVSIAAALQFI